MGGKTSRRKGAAWQAELARRWRGRGLFPGAHSTQGEQTRSGRGLGTTPPDVDGTPFWVEAKHHKGGVLGALRQASAEALAAEDKRMPIAVVRPHGYGPLGAVVVMRLETFELLADCAVRGLRLADVLDVRAKIEASGNGWDEDAKSEPEAAE